MYMYVLVDYVYECCLHLFSIRRHIDNETKSDHMLNSKTTLREKCESGREKKIEIDR